MSKKKRTRFCSEPGCNAVIMKEKKFCDRHNGKHFDDKIKWVKPLLDQEDQKYVTEME